MPGGANKSRGVGSSVGGAPTPRTKALLLITDGRQRFLKQTLASAHNYLPYFDYMVAVDDSLDDAFGKWLDNQFDGAVIHHGTKGGLSGAVDTGWEYLRNAGADWVFHLEDDFVFQEPVPVEHMIGLCEDHSLGQMCLVRQPISPVEVSLGSMLEAHRGQPAPKCGYMAQDWLFSLNPCVYPRWVMAHGWPAAGGEREFTDDLLADNPGLQFGYYGSPNDPPRCWHIGMERSPTWKL